MCLVNVIIMFRGCTFLVFFMLAFFLGNAANGRLKTLQLVHVLFRHGDRTPDIGSVYPNDPYINETYSPIGYGQLTNEGKRREFTIGKFLRKRYSSFLGKYTPFVVDARSTSFNRTKMSLQLVLASLYPPENEEVWQSGMKWQPIPYNYVEKEYDQLLGFPKHVCPQFLKQLNKYLHSEEGRNRYKKYKNAFEYLSKHSGWNVNSTNEMSELYLTLIAEKDWGRKLPEWTAKVFPEPLRAGAVEEYTVRTPNTIMKRLSTGFLIKKIIEDSRMKIKGMLPGRKLYLYSAHEHNIGSLLRTLNYEMKMVPPYGSFIVFEVHKVGNKYGFKIFYQNYETRKLKPIRVPNCSMFCRLEKFYSIYKEILPKSQKECF